MSSFENTMSDHLTIYKSTITFCRVIIYSLTELKITTSKNDKDGSNGSVELRFTVPDKDNSLLQ